MWDRSLRAVKNSLPTPCRNRRLPLNAHNSRSDSGHRFWQGVGKRGGNQLGLVHMSRVDVLKAEGMADLCHPGHADGTHYGWFM